MTDGTGMFRWGSASDIGRVRAVNQDCAYADEGLFVVADGMGGHSGGEVASAVAVDSLAAADSPVDIDDLVDVVNRANDQVVACAVDDPSLRGMGTTVCVLSRLGYDEQRLGIANVGDSRIYRLDDDDLEQLTQDHSLVEALVRDGRLTSTEAASHPQRNVLTRALGIDSRVLVDAWEIRAITGDRFLLCSDGLFNELESGEIAGVLRRLADPAEAADELVRAAVASGGRDNVTVLVVDVVDGGTDGDGDRVVRSRMGVPEGPEVDDVRDGLVAGTDDAEVEADGDETDVEARGDDEGDTDSTMVATDPDGQSPGGRVLDEQVLDEQVLDGQGLDDDLSPRVLTWRLALFVAGVIVVMVILGTAVVAYARSGYYVGVDDRGDVVVFQGREGGLLWFDPTIEERFDVGIAALPDEELDALRRGVEFDNLSSARSYGQELVLRGQADNSQ